MTKLLFLPSRRWHTRVEESHKRRWVEKSVSGTELGTLMSDWLHHIGRTPKSAQSWGVKGQHGAGKLSPVPKSLPLYQATCFYLRLCPVWMLSWMATCKSHLRKSLAQCLPLLLVLHTRFWDPSASHEGHNSHSGGQTAVLKYMVSGVWGVWMQTSEPSFICCWHGVSYLTVLSFGSLAIHKQNAYSKGWNIPKVIID